MMLLLGTILPADAYENCLVPLVEMMATLLMVVLRAKLLVLQTTLLALPKNPLASCGGPHWAELKWLSG